MSDDPRRDWTCLGPGPRHAVALETVEVPFPSWTSEVAIHRCRSCGQLYRYSVSELNDWGASGDRTDMTYVWAPIEAGEIEAVRRDINYRPKSERFHRYDNGWQ